MEKSKADSDIHGEKWDHEIDMHALGPSTTDDQRLESSLIRELQKWKITRCIICRDFFSDVNRIVLQDIDQKCTSRRMTPIDKYPPFDGQTIDIDLPIAPAVQTQ
uniref:Uncharacterized protein n=1 Tax=Salix viminalis TaxID=40686 RepID=A0A6N2KKI9_SALVM